MTTELAERVEQDTTNTAANLVAAKTICLVLKRGKWGNKRKAPMGDVTVEADKALLRLTKQLLDSPELQEIYKLDNEVQSYLRAVAFSSMLKGGVYLVSMAMVSSIIDALKEFRTRRTALVDVAVQMLPVRITETTARLGIVAEPDDYPTAAGFRGSFTFAWSLMSFDTPTRLKAISEEIYQEEVDKARERVTAVADECRDAMRSGLLHLIDHFVERLTPGADGKAKKFHKSTITNLNEFLAMFDMKNVTDDDALADLVKQTRAAMVGIDPKLIKDDELVRTNIMQKFDAVKSQLQPMTVRAGTRRIDLDDDDA